MDFVECYECQRQINPGEPYRSINDHCEMFTVDRTIKVIRAESVATYCMECAALRDFDRIDIPLKM